MTNTAYQTSKELARGKGSFERYPENAEPMNKVLTMHQEATNRIDETKLPESLRNVTTEAKKMGLEMLLETEQGYRNAQVTVLAPTGTIGFMMDCDTKVFEPDISLVKYKHFVGEEKPRRIINESVEPSLKRMGYSPEQIRKIIDHLERTETMETSPDLNAEHLEVFDCSLKSKHGKRYIPYPAHLKMMSAVQPFLSGAISKTVNMPEEATPQQIYDTYIEGWKMGLKALAIYRDNSKKVQPMRTSNDEKEGLSYGILVREGDEPGIRPLRVGDESGLIKLMGQISMRLPPQRRKLPQTRMSITHKFEIGDVATGTNGERLAPTDSTSHETYLNLGFFDDGHLGEIFYTSGKEGGTVGGLLDGLGTTESLLLQYGMPISDMVKKFENTAFPPNGVVLHRGEMGLVDKQSPEQINFAKSITDYTMKYLKETCTVQEPGLPRRDAPHIAFRRGLMGQELKESTKEEKHFDHTDFFKMKKEDLLKKANVKCTGGVCGCGKDAIKVGKCGWWCIETGRLIEGTCAE